MTNLFHSASRCTGKHRERVEGNLAVIVILCLLLTPPSSPRVARRAASNKGERLHSTTFAGAQRTENVMTESSTAPACAPWHHISRHKKFAKSVSLLDTTP